MSLVFEKLSQSLAAAQAWPIYMAGDMVRIAGAQWPVTVELRRQGVVIGRMSNVLAGDYARDVEFDQIVITNGATAQDVTVQIVGGGVGSDRVLGEVSVIDGGKSRVLNASSFIYGAGIGAVVGQYGYVLLWNESTTKNIVVNQIAGITAAGTLLTGRYFSAVSGAATQWGKSKLMGGADSVVGQIYTGNNAALLGAGMGLKLSATAQLLMKPTEPIVIPPGKGFGMIADTVNVVISNVSFDGYEEAI